MSAYLKVVKCNRVFVTEHLQELFCRQGKQRRKKVVMELCGSGSERESNMTRKAYLGRNSQTPQRNFANKLLSDSTLIWILVPLARHQERIESRARQADCITTENPDGVEPCLVRRTEMNTKGLAHLSWEALDLE
jgi:hypothetical protein